MFRRDKNYLELQSAGQSAEPGHGSNPADADRQFAARAGSVPPDAGLRSDAVPAIANPRSAWAIPATPTAGPASTTVEGGTEPLLSKTVNEVTNSYRMGVDYRGLPKTTLSYDELLTYTRDQQQRHRQ